VTRRRLALLLLLVVASLVLVAAAAVVLLPRYARPLVVWQLRAATGRPVALAAADLSLATGEFSLRGLQVRDHDGGVLAELDSLEGRLHRRSLLQLHLWIERLTLTNGRVRIVRLSGNRFNISDLLDRPASRGPFALSIDRLTISGGWVALEDRTLTPARTWRSENIRLDAREVTTLAPRGVAFGSTTVAGALVTLRVEDLRLAPVHLRATVNLRDVDLRLAALYLPADALLTLGRGTVDAGLTVVVDERDGTTVDADAVIRHLALRRRGVPGDALTAPELQLLVRELGQRGSGLGLRYASLGGDATVLDPTTSPPRPLTFSDFTVTASGREEDLLGSAQVAVHASVPGGGEVDLAGTVGLARRRADLRVRARDIEVATLARYLPLEGRVSGLGTADVRVVASQEGPLQLTVTGRAHVDQVALGDGSRTLASAARASASEVVYTWPARVTIGQITLTKPVVMVERDGQGGLGLATLLRAPAPTPGDSAVGAAPRTRTLDVAVARLQIDDGRASITDASTGATARLARGVLTGTDMSWPPRGIARIQLSTEVAGGRLTARGTVDGARRGAEMAVTVRGADLATLQPWLPIVGGVRGTAEADLTITLALQTPLELTARGTLGVAELAFVEGTRPLLSVRRVDATGVDLQWPASLAIDRLRVRTPWAQIERNPQGQLSLRAIFTRRADRPAPAMSEPVAAGPVPGLEVSVRDAQFEDGGLSIVDTAVEPAARFELRGSRLELRNLSWPTRGPAQLTLTTPMPGAGTLKARGTFSIEPTRVQLDAELDQVDLAPGRPYLPFDARLAGRVSGRAKVTGSFDDTISLVIDGDAALDRLALGDTDRRLATAQRAELTGVRYQYPTSVRVRALAVRKPWALVERNPDGSLQLVAMLAGRPRPPASATTTDAAATSTAAPPVRVALQKLTLEDGFLRFVDRTTDPDYAEELSGITLVAEGLGTNPRRHGTLDLRGTLASGTPLTVRGQVGGLTGPRFLDLTLEANSLPVVRLNPYLDQLSSWIARQGTLTASLRYRLDGDDLEATNVIDLYGLELEQGGHGHEVQQRVGLSLGMLVSLLKNRQGEIHLTLPVQGRLSAPDFHYGEAMWTAVRNLAIKLVSLPFSWIGGMFYTKDARIDSIQVWPVTFATARATPTRVGGEQLERLVSFLKESPAIRLRVRPVTTVADVSALRRAALDARIALAGAEPAARRQAAIALYAELFPRREPPASDEVLFEELTRETPTPPRALRALATDRTTAIRDAIAAGGVAADRLEAAESRTAVESEGEGRVEFEIVR
jgi:Domain of Unknown Function (DUF748)